MGRRWDSETGAMGQAGSTKEAAKGCSVKLSSTQSAQGVVREYNLCPVGLSLWGEMQEHAQYEPASHLPSSCSLLHADRSPLSGTAAARFITVIAVWFAFIKETAGTPN